MQSSDITTLGGVTIAVTVLVQLVKKAYPNFSKGRERVLALASVFALFFGAKMLGIGLGEMSWLTLAVLVPLASALSGAIHEHLVRPSASDKPEPCDPPSPE